MLLSLLSVWLFFCFRGVVVILVFGVSVVLGVVVLVRVIVLVLLT